MNTKTPILGQEAICPDGLGRVSDFDLSFPRQYIRVQTYVNDRSCNWAPHNVELIDPRPARTGTCVECGGSDHHADWCSSVEPIVIAPKNDGRAKLPAEWTPYKPGDEVPRARFYWVVVESNMGGGAHLAEYERIAKGGGPWNGFCAVDGGNVNDLVTHYIPIATPELPK